MTISPEKRAYLRTYLKKYLRIDYAEDDDFITDIILTGFNYLEDAIDHFGELYAGDTDFADKADMWVITQWAPPMYDQREGMFNPDTAMNYAARAMLTQLQMHKYEPEEEDADE